MPATIKRSAQNANVYGAYGIMSSDNRQQRAQNPSQQPEHCAFDYHTRRASSRG
jgi:hypothetical protein